MGIKYVFNPTTGNLDATSVETPAGSNTQIQFNDAGSFGGDADLTWNKTTNVLTNRGDINLDDGGTYTTTVQCVTPTANRTISFPDATGTVALVAGSSGQLTYNNAGANAGLSTATIGATGNVSLTLNGAASTPPLAFTGTWFTGGTSTTTKPQVLIEPTGTTSTAWSTSGTGFGVNAASGFTGNLLDLQVNGTSYFKVTGTAIDVDVFGSNTTRLVAAGQETWQFRRGSSGSVRLQTNSLGVAVASDAGYRFASAVSADASADLGLFRDAANTLAQRNGTNAQTSRVYGTYTDGSNYVRASLSSTSTAVTLAAETAGTGADNIPLNLTAAGTGTIKVNSVAEVAVSSTVNNLPAAPAVGMLTRVTDASAPAVGSTVAGGGAAAALVWYNGTNWTVIGV